MSPCFASMTRISITHITFDETMAFFTSHNKTLQGQSFTCSEAFLAFCFFVSFPLSKDHGYPAATRLSCPDFLVFG